MHELETHYGLSASELLDAINCRFRLKVAVGGAVAEVQMEKHVAKLIGGVVERYEANDMDGRPDFSIWLHGVDKPILAECKNARNDNYRRSGADTHYRVELQKTRAAMGDPTSRSYGFDQFQVLGVCLGIQTGDWTDFLFIRTVDLPPQSQHPHKIQIMNRVPLLDGELGPWSTDLAAILKKFQ